MIHLCPYNWEAVKETDDPLDLQLHPLHPNVHRQGSRHHDRLQFLVPAQHHCSGRDSGRIFPHHVLEYEH